MLHLQATILLEDPNAISRLPSPPEFTTFSDAIARDPGNMRLHLAKAVYAFQGWNDGPRDRGILVAEKLGIVIAKGGPKDLEVAARIIERMQTELGRKREFPHPDVRTFLGLFKVGEDDAIDMLEARVLDPLEDAGIIPSASAVVDAWRADRYFNPSDVLRFLRETALARLPKDAR